MSVAILDAVREAFEALRDALDGEDAAAINAASARLREAAMRMKGVGAWRDDPQLREKLSKLAPLIESARVRTTVLSDLNRQRIDLLASFGAISAPLTYGR